MRRAVFAHFLCWILMIICILEGCFLTVVKAALVLVPRNETAYAFAQSVIPKNFHERRYQAERGRVLFLVCGIILGIPLCVLTAYGIQEFVCDMWERHRLHAMRSTYMHRLSVIAAAYRDRYR